MITTYFFILLECNENFGVWKEHTCNVPAEYQLNSSMAMREGKRAKKARRELRRQREGKEQGWRTRSKKEGGKDSREAAGIAGKEGLQEESTALCTEVQRFTSQWQNITFKDKDYLFSTGPTSNQWNQSLDARCSKWHFFKSPQIDSNLLKALSMASWGGKHIIKKVKLEWYNTQRENFGGVKQEKVAHVQPHISKLHLSDLIWS